MLLGGEEGRQRLEGILALPAQSAFGQPAYPDLFTKAAVLLRSVVLDHPFMDGNKRMGMAAAMFFLSMNGLAVCASDDEVVDFTLRVATGQERNLDAMANWLREQSLQLDDILHAIETDSVPDLLTSLPGDAELQERPILRSLIHGE